MKENNTSNPDSARRTTVSGPQLIKSVDSFFHKPAGACLICLLLFGLTAWTFAPGLKTAFQYFDEGGELTMNAHVKSGLSWQNLRWALFSQEYSNWYPVTWISHMLDFRLFGPRPWGHHLTNVLLHAANGVLLFLVLKRMTGALWRSFAVAALFVLHPLRVESVVWISERKDVLSAFFGLLALWMYACYAGDPRRQGGGPKLFYGLTLLFFALGLMSKSMLVTFPCLLWLLDFWPLERWRRESKCKLIWEKIPFFLLIVPVSVAVYFAQNYGGQFLLHFPLSFRLETALMGYARYLGKMFWPANLSVLYPYPDYWPASQVLGAFILILGISTVVFVLRRTRPYLLVGWLWYLGTLVPVIGLITLGAQSMSNRYTYIPMIGMLLLLVWAVGDWSKKRPRRTLLITIAIGLLLGVSIFRTRVEIVYWKNNETLWSRAVAVTQDNFMAHYCYANVLWPPKPGEALAEYEKTVSLRPDYAAGQRELGFVLQALGRLPDAVVHLKIAIQLEPRNSWTYRGLGRALLQLHRVSKAIPPLLTAVEQDPQNGVYKDELNQAVYSTDHETVAVSNLLAAVRSDPAAFEGFLDAVQSDTNRAVMFNNMAWSFATFPDAKLRNGRYALRLATRANELTGYKAFYCLGTLGAAYAENSRFDEAIAAIQRASSLASAAGQAKFVKTDQEMLQLFLMHQPFHEPVQTASP